MPPSYYLYSTRNQGWFTGSGTYSTDITQAQTCARTDAIALARKHKTQGGYQLLPVAVADMEAI
jgi:hypothetical protein